MMEFVSVLLAIAAFAAFMTFIEWAYISYKTKRTKGSDSIHRMDPVSRKDEHVNKRSKAHEEKRC